MMSERESAGAADGKNQYWGRPVRGDDGFGSGPLLAPDELAARYGEADGLGVHMDPESARYLWLDRAGRACRA